MALQKKFQPVEELLVFPSLEPTIEVIPNDGYDSKKQTSTYIDKTDTIQFVQKNEDGSVIPGWQSEQLALILLDRVKKLNAKYPSDQNSKQIEGLEMYLAACKERIEERINRGVMGELKK